MSDRPLGCGVPVSGPLAGLDRETLTAMLGKAQQAYADLLLGNKAVTVSYAQGNGSRSVTYTSASVANLSMFIAQLQRALGLSVRSLGPVRPYFL